MKSVGMREAKRHLSSLVRDFVENGYEVVITKYGRPVGRLVPAFDRAKAQAAMDWILARNWPLDGLSIREMIDEGKRL
jgi:prevent-host-death family protein